MYIYFTTTLGIKLLRLVIQILLALKLSYKSSIRYRALYVESTASTYTINDQEKKKYVAVRILVVVHIIMIKALRVSEYGSRRASTNAFS